MAGVCVCLCVWKMRKAKGKPPQHLVVHSSLLLETTPTIETGTKGLAKRKLPARVVGWLVVVPPCCVAADRLFLPARPLFDLINHIPCNGHMAKKTLSSHHPVSFHGGGGGHTIMGCFSPSRALPERLPSALSFPRPWAREGN